MGGWCVISQQIMELAGLLFNNELQLMLTFIALAVSGTNLFAGTYGGGVFLSTNNGTNWTAVNNGLTNSNVCSCCQRNKSLCGYF